MWDILHQSRGTNKALRELLPFINNLHSVAFHCLVNQAAAVIVMTLLSLRAGDARSALVTPCTEHR